MFFLLFCDFCYWQDWSVGLIISVINHSYYKPNFTNLYNTALLSSTLCPKKNVPDIFVCNLKTNYQILIVFGMNIPDTTCHQMTI